MRSANAFSNAAFGGPRMNFPEEKTLATEEAISPSRSSSYRVRSRRGTGGELMRRRFYGSRAAQQVRREPVGPCIGKEPEARAIDERTERGGSIDSLEGESAPARDHLLDDALVL